MSVIGEFDGFPVNKIEGGRVPVFLLDDVVSQLNGVTLVEEVGFQFRGVGVSVNENIPVSYTHLRAHETREDLVCRLLLEKKKK